MKTRRFGEENNLLLLLGIEPSLRSSSNKAKNRQEENIFDNDIGKG
jgi:hypothetical protein